VENLGALHSLTVAVIPNLPVTLFKPLMRPLTTFSSWLSILLLIAVIQFTSFCLQFLMALLNLDGNCLVLSIILLNTLTALSFILVNRLDTLSFIPRTPF